MKLSVLPPRSSWRELIARPACSVTALFEVISPIFDAVRDHGDDALRGYGRQFDDVELDSLEVAPEEIEHASTLLDDELKRAIRLAKNNIARFHSAQRFVDIKVQTMPGVECQQRAVPIERVGLYIPGGSAPLFSTVLMLAVPAMLAGCSELVLCTPPSKTGSIDPAILFTAQICGVSKVFKVGGAQAIAAMALGTKSVPRVDKIFGPGNTYVMAAKQWASLHGVAIDMPAGPSEVQVIADESCIPSFVAADLLSQAEHGADSQVMLVVTSQTLVSSIRQELDRQLPRLARREIAEAALKNSHMLVLNSLDDIVDFTNQYAPEHLIIAMDKPEAISERITTAGSVFLGNWSSESAGDYASGTNHTLPTSGYARAYSGLSLGSFQRKMTLQKLSPEGVKSIGKAVVAMAEAEQLDAHAQAMSLRLEAIDALGTKGEDEQSFLTGLVRPNIQHLAPYVCARDEYQGGGEGAVFLDANESPFGELNLNRYPDPLQSELKQRLAKLKQVEPEQIILGNGSDEIIDLIFRVFCEPRLDNVVVLEPSYGMYQVCADVNDVACRKVRLRSDYTFRAIDVLNAVDDRTKAVFLCSPNNPTGNLLSSVEIKYLLDEYQDGIVVLDEAYIDFSPGASWRPRLSAYPRLVLLSTFSKAWASAGIRLGMAFAHPEIIRLMNKVKYPYNVSELTQRYALKLLEQTDKINEEIQAIITERERLRVTLATLPIVREVFPSDANFILVRLNDADAVYSRLLKEQIVVRNRHRVALCDNCIRITIGTPSENDTLINALKTL